MGQQWEHPEILTVSGGVTAPRGFKASGVHAGLKRAKKDVSLVFSETPCAVGGVFTTNQVVAAPVTVTKSRIGERVRAIVINSANANACNGEQGMTDALRMAEVTADALGIEEKEVLVASTGVIGEPMPMDKVEQGIVAAGRSLDEHGGHDAAEGILTTDTRTKEYAVEVKTTGGATAYRIGAMAKGSGMIHPNMATMLAFITTDALVERDFLQETIKEAVDQSFNLISVDGDTSTNDMVLILANGAAGGVPMTRYSAGANVFAQTVTDVCIELAKMIAADGEGATKLIEVAVEGAKSQEDARLIVRSISKSPLVKTAIHGEDANWGRIIAAAGYSGATFDFEKVSIFLGDVQVCQDGVALPFDEEAASQVLKERNVRLRLKLSEGEGAAVGWACDLSAEYVRINGGYRS